MAGKSANTDLKKYEGNCHCGQFRFVINIPQLQKVEPCNCSSCQRDGFLWISPVAEDAFVITRGEGSLKTYEFGKRSMAHQFCPKCGTSVMVRTYNVPKDEAIAINARTIKDLDLDALTVEPFPGVNLEPHYQAPDPPISDKQAEAGKLLYNGNCHCGAVRYIVENKPITEVEVMSCNCSLCTRNGGLWIYPTTAAVELFGGENLTDYLFLHETSLHSFCSICGVSVLVRVTDPGSDVMPINVRTIDGIDLSALKYIKYDGWRKDPQYSI